MTRLSKDTIQRIISQVFHTPDHRRIMYAIVMAESGGVLDAVNDNYPRWQSLNSPYRWDYGLAQINSVHGYDKDRLLKEPFYNLTAAREIFSRQGWNAWTTYRWGLYEKYLEPLMPARLTKEELQAVWITEYYNGPEPKHVDVMRSEIKSARVEGDWDIYEIRIRRRKNYKGRV